MIGQQIGQLILPGSGENGGSFAWLEKIENGVLVHYSVPVNTRKSVPAHMLGLPSPPEFSEPKERVIVIWSVSKKTAVPEKSPSLNYSRSRSKTKRHTRTLRTI